MRVFRYLYGFTTPPNFRSPFHIMKTTKKAPNLAGRGLRVLLTSKGNYETSTCIVGRVFQQGAIAMKSSSLIPSAVYAVPLLVLVSATSHPSTE